MFDIEEQSPKKIYTPDVFEPAIQKIQSRGIQDFVRFALRNIPEYFFWLPASTSGKFHGGETVIEHTLACLYIADKVCGQQLKDSIGQSQKDVIRAALILHDTYRCGEPDKELKKDGVLRTNGNHPLVAARELKKLAKLYNDPETTETSETRQKVLIKNHEICAICNAISFHYGPFQKDFSKEELYLPSTDISDTEQLKWGPHWSYSSPLMLVHLCDFMESTCSRYYNKKKGS